MGDEPGTPFLAAVVDGENVNREMGTETQNGKVRPMEPKLDGKSTRVTEILLAKIDEQIERLTHIIAQLPVGRLDWAPEIPTAVARPPRRLGSVLGHLLECLAGFVAVLYAAHPEQLGHFQELKNRRVNRLCAEAEALERIAEYGRHIHEGFQLLDDRDLTRPLQTVFVPEGEPVLTLLLGNIEHLINHKHELFLYGKMLGLPLATPDLYRFRGAAVADAQGDPNSGA